MKIRLVLSSFALAVAAAPLGWAQDSTAPASSPAAPAPAQAAPADQKKEKKTELETRMDKIGKAYRKLKKQIADPAQNDASLQLVATMMEGAKEAIDLTPKLAADVPEDQRAKFMDDFQAGIKDLQAEFVKLEDALKAGKNDDAAAIVKEIDALEKKSHKAFRKPEKD